MSIARFAVLVSGNGSNLQALIDEIHNKSKGYISLVLSDKHEAYGLERARQAGIKAISISSQDFPNYEDFNRALLSAVIAEKVDFVVLAGYMRILTPHWIQAFPQKIINIHPSLIPRHCGKGFYGIRVAKSVIESGDKQTGVTIHYVDEGTDTGEIIAQEKTQVFADDTPESLQQRVLKIEHKLLPQVVAELCEKVEKEKL